MRCATCGRDNGEEARFCNGCGGPLSASAMRPVARPYEAATIQRPSDTGRTMIRAMVCPRCGMPAGPESYFSRGVNVAKLVALLPFSVFAPLVFFFLRKDRVICANCQGLLPEGAGAALLAAAGSSLVPLKDAQRAMAAAQNEKQIRKLRVRGQRRKRWGVAFGAASLGSVGMAWSGEPTFFLGMSGLFAMTSVYTLVRGQKLEDRAAETERREQGLRILAMAAESGGRLSVTQVATKMGIDLAEAERILDGMVDGRRVDVRNDDSGRIWYVFPELMA